MDLQKIRCSVSIVFILGCAINAVAQDNLQREAALATGKMADNGYFKWELTGNDSLDNINYGNAKLEFVSDFPDRYEKMVAENIHDKKHAIDYNEYLLMPANKKEEIDNNMDMYYFINK